MRWLIGGSTHIFLLKSAFLIVNQAVNFIFLLYNGR